MLDRILVCLEGTKSGEAVIPVVTELAAKLHSQLILLHVIAVPSRFAGIGEVELEPYCPTEMLESDEKDVRYLDEVAGLLREKGLEAEVVIVEGAVGESIVACAREYKADLIAMENHNRCKLMRMINGSIKDFVQSKIDVPVLSIKLKASAGY